MAPITLLPSRSFKFPAVPYKLETNDGYMVFDIAKQIMDPENIKELEVYVKLNKLYKVGILMTMPMMLKFGL